MQGQLLASLAVISSRVRAFRSIASRAAVVRPLSIMESACSSDDIRLPKIYSTLDEVENELQNRHPCNSDEDNAADLKSVPLEHSLPHLFLHFDVNETILVGDPAGGDTVTDCLNKIIAKSAFVSTDSRATDGESTNYNQCESRKGLVRSPSSGNITPTSTHNVQPTFWWNGQSIEDSTCDAPPLYAGWTWPPNTCPYYRTSLKKLAKRFTEGHGCVYRPLYEELCHKLCLDDGLNGNIADENAAGHNIFANFIPAFFHTLQFYFPTKSLNAQTKAVVRNGYLPLPLKVTLVLRTFGTDLPRVAQCISEFAKGNHPSYPDYYNPDLILDRDLFCSSWTYRDVHGNIVETENKEKELVYELHSITNDKVGNHSQNRIAGGDLTGDNAILNYLQTRSIVGIQDCYGFWRDNNHAPWSGKPVWARTNISSSHNHHHILLDDNIHNDPSDGAGGIRVPAKEEKEDDKHSYYESLHGPEALNMHGKHLIRVPTICPLMEDDWFIQQIEKARWKHYEDDVRDKLKSADVLELSGKNLTDEYFTNGLILPSTLCSIDLSRNNLTQIPQQIFSLSNLTFLDISRNSIQGIPHEVSHLTNLVKLIALSNPLRLSQISIEGLTSLPQLKLLDLRYNKKLKQSALHALQEMILPYNTQLEIICTIPVKQQDKENKLSACDRDATLLQSQLEPISTPQLCKRLERTFGIALDKQSDLAYDREYIMKTLLQCYNKHGAREIRKEQGIPVSLERQKALLKELEAINWPRTTRERPKIRAEYYMILQKPGTGKAHSTRTKKETAKLMKYKNLFDQAVEALAEIDPEFSNRFTALAVTKNFVGSPHIDTLNVGPFYGMSLGDFSGGGAIAVECSPLLVAEVETRGRLGKVDGRFPHWVTPYSGNRFSLIYYVTSGSVEPQTTAIFAPPLEINPNWIQPPIFVP